MKQIFDPATFTATGKNLHGYEIGTVLLDDGKVATAIRYERGDIAVHGFVGRYRTSNKVWPAYVVTMDDRIVVQFGRDDRSGRFRKEKMISYEPENYNKAHSNPSFWEAC